MVRLSTGPKRPSASAGPARCAPLRTLGVDVRRERVGGGGAQRAVDAHDAVGAQRVGGGGGIGGDGGGGPAGARLGLLARRLRDELALAARHLLHRWPANASPPCTTTPSK